MCEADFPLRKGWFYHDREKGTTKRAAYLLQRYVGTVGNGGIMNIGIAPNKAGVLDEDDVRELKGFGEMQNALFANEITGDGKAYNMVEMCEDLANGEQVDGWRVLADGKEILSGKSIGYRRMRLLETPVSPQKTELQITAHGGLLLPITLRRYYVEPDLVHAILTATGDCGETDTVKGLGDGKKSAVAL
jgi:alpha-L-fucosidase